MLTASQQRCPYHPCKAVFNRSRYGHHISNCRHAPNAMQVLGAERCLAQVRQAQSIDRLRAQADPVSAVSAREVPTGVARMTPTRNPCDWLMGTTLEELEDIYPDPDMDMNDARSDGDGVETPSRTDSPKSRKGALKATADYLRGHGYMLPTALSDLVTSLKLYVYQSLVRSLQSPLPPAPAVEEDPNVRGALSDKKRECARFLLMCRTLSHTQDAICQHLKYHNEVNPDGPLPKDYRTLVKYAEEVISATMPSLGAGTNEFMNETNIERTINLLTDLGIDQRFIDKIPESAPIRKNAFVTVRYVDSCVTGFGLSVCARILFGCFCWLGCLQKTTTLWLKRKTWNSPDNCFYYSNTSQF